MLEGVYHKDEAGDTTEDEEVTLYWCDLGPETSAEWERQLKARLSNAKNAGITNTGCQHLEGLL